MQSHEEQANEIVFTYLKTCDRKPAWIEMPRWIVEDDIHKRVLEYLRTQITVEAGYSYTIETADQVAVILRNDQQHFYRLQQDWAASQAILVTFSWKLVSKRCGVDQSWLT